MSNSVSEWCGRAVAARLLPDSCPVPAQQPVAAARFLRARFLPGSCPTAGPGRKQDPPLGRPVPAQEASEPGSNRPAAASLSRVLLGCCTTHVRMLPTCNTRKRGSVFPPLETHKTTEQKQNKQKTGTCCHCCNKVELLEPRPSLLHQTVQNCPHSGLCTTPPLVSVPGMLAQVRGLPEEARGHLVRISTPSLLAALVIIVIEMAVSRICRNRNRLDAE